jgi:3-hydroxy-9,10-secoandrosta-1,3,5(10)-triene-9,17-dione monooxygenase
MNESLPQTVRIPSRETLLARAREMIPRLRGRAIKCETIRRLPQETHRDFIAAGFYRIHQPRRFGGYELDWGLLADLTVELARGCPSSGWVFAQLGGHAYFQGMRVLQAQEELWGDNPDATVSSGFPIEGATTTPADGGYVLNGAWNFASGCDVAEWNDFMCFVPRPGGGPPVHLFCLAPRSQWTIEDDWFPNGLAGTGSRRVVVRDVFVPEHRTLKTEDARGLPTIGSRWNPGPLYRLPLMGAGGSLFSGTVIGAVRGAYDFIDEQFRTRTSVAGVKLSEQQSVQLRLAEADALICAAHALVNRNDREAMQHAEAGEQPPLESRVRWRRDSAFAIKLCLDALDRVLHPLAGGRGLDFHSPFQRAFRDAHAAASQVIVNWDLMATHWGRVHFGLPLADPRI